MFLTISKSELSAWTSEIRTSLVLINLNDQPKLGENKMFLLIVCLVALSLTLLVLLVRKSIQLGRIRSKLTNLHSVKIEHESISGDQYLRCVTCTESGVEHCMALSPEGG